MKKNPPDHYAEIGMDQPAIPKSEPRDWYIQHAVKLPKRGNECEKAKRKLGPSNYVEPTPEWKAWTDAVNNGSTTQIKLFDKAGNQIAEVRCLTGHKMEIIDAWDMVLSEQEKGILIEALRDFEPSDEYLRLHGRVPKEVISQLGMKLNNQ